MNLKTFPLFLFFGETMLEGVALLNEFKDCVNEIIRQESADDFHHSGPAKTA